MAITRGGSFQIFHEPGCWVADILALRGNIELPEPLETKPWEWKVVHQDPLTESNRITLAFIKFFQFHTRDPLNLIGILIILVYI